CRHRLLNRVAAATAAAAATYILRNGVAAGEDTQAKVPTQAKLDRDARPGVDGVDRGEVVHRLQEARPVVAHLVTDPGPSRVASVIGAGPGDALHADRARVERPTALAGEAGHRIRRPRCDRGNPAQLHRVGADGGV